MSNIEGKKLKYGFTFNKRGLDPVEFGDCLNQKVEKLLEDTDLTRIETLKKQSITEVKQLCMRKNTTRPGMDKRFKSVQTNIGADVIRNPEDTPMAHNEDSRGKQGRVKKQKQWHEDSHISQHELFLDPLKQKIQTLFPTIEIKDDGKEKGYLFHSAKEGGKELTAIEFCNVIDVVTYDLLQNLTAVKRKDPMPDQLDFEKVYELCKDIVLKRNAVDWVNENDLMNESNTKIWRDHLMVVMSFAALAVVSSMIKKVEKLPKSSFTNLLRLIPLVLVVMWSRSG